MVSFCFIFEIIDLSSGPPLYIKNDDEIDTIFTSRSDMTREGGVEELKLSHRNTSRFGTGSLGFSRSSSMIRNYI